MFEFLRKMIGPIMILVLVAFIATIIFSWGGGGFREGPRDTVGVIDGEEISIKTFDRYYTNLVRSEQQKTDEDLTPEQTAELRKKAWTQLVADFLINREIDKRDIQITPEEIYEYLKFYPPQVVQEAAQFQTDGKFDYQKYINAMVNPQNAPMWSQLEQYVLPDLKRTKLQSRVVSTVRVTPSEVMNAYLDKNEKVKIGFVNIQSLPIEKKMESPSEDEIKAYYEEHKEDYKQPKKVSIDLVQFDKVPSQNDWDKGYYIIKDIYDSAVAGVDFAELASAFSDDRSADKGGDLGWFSAGQMVKPFDSAVATLDIDEISKPVKTRYGWHIIKLFDKKMEKQPVPGIPEPQMVQRYHAAHILVKVEPSQEAIDETYNAALDFQEAAKAEGLQASAERYNYDVKKTSPFDENSYIQYLGNMPDANKFAFSHKPGEVSPVLENKVAYFVFAVDSVIPSGYTAYGMVAPGIAQQITAKKAAEETLDTAKAVYDAINPDLTLRGAAGRFGFEYKTTDMISREDMIPTVGRSDEVIGAAFALKDINQVSKPIQYERGAVILTLLDRQSANVENFNQVRDSLAFAVQMQKSQDVYSRWFDHLIKEAKIENYVDQFYSSNQ